MKNLLCFSIIIATLGSRVGATHGIHHPTSAILWVNCSTQVPNVPGALNLTGVDLEKLPPTLHCGRLEVPMDYSRPMQADNKIEIGLAMHRPSKPRGVIFYNPGGSDAGVVVAWQLALGQTTIFDGLLDYDLLVMDVRGTYSSSPLNVSLDLFQALFGPYPTTPSEYEVFQNASAAVVQSWIDLSSPPGIVAHVSTKEVVQDYEMVRKALGYCKINFLGASYGSYRAQQYAFDFPDQVGHFVLDAVTPHALSLSESALDSIAANNRALDRVDAYCRQHRDCPFYTQGRGSVIAAFHTLVDVAYNISALASFGVREWTSGALLQGASGPPDYPAILSGLHAALLGNFSSFDSSTPLTVADVVAMPLECSDQAEQGLTYESFSQSLTEGLKRDTSGIGIAFAWQIQLWCSSWPYGFLEKTPLLVRKPMLLVTSDFDDGAPTEWTTLGWRQAPESGLVVRHGDGHVSFILAGAPSNTLTESFLRTGELPSQSDNTSFTVYLPGGIREPIADPYLVPFELAASHVEV